MYNQSYEEYIRSILGYPNYQYNDNDSMSYMQNQGYNYNNNFNNNYSENEDNTAIFEGWCDFPNNFESSMRFQLSL